MEGTESNPSKKRPREGKKPCQIGYCPGSVDMVHIPLGSARAAVLMAPPFNWTKTDVEKAAGVALFVCRCHLQSYAPGSSQGYFVMHPINDDPIVKGILNGEMMPQREYLARSNQTFLTFLTELQSRVDRSNYLREPVSAAEPSTSSRKRRSLDVADNGGLQDEVERLQKIVADLKADRTTSNKSYSMALSDCKKEIGVLKTNNALLQATVIDLEARVTQLISETAWTSETILGFSNVDFKAIFGLEKEQWKGYLTHLELHGASAAWKHSSVDWKTGYAISQIKLRQNLIYALIRKIFKVPASTCSTIFKSCIEFSATVTVHVLDIDAREYSSKFRIQGIRYDHHNVPWTKIRYFTDANEVPMQQLHNEEAAHKAYSDYYGDNRLKHQCVIGESGELVWASKMYLPRGASDQELLKKGESVAAGVVPAKKVYDLMQGLVKIYICWYVLGECLSQACMYLYVFM